MAYFQNNTLVGGDPLGFHADPWKMFRGYLLVLVLGLSGIATAVLSLLYYGFGGEVERNSAMPGIIRSIATASWEWPLLIGILITTRRRRRIAVRAQAS